MRVLIAERGQAGRAAAPRPCAAKAWPSMSPYAARKLVGWRDPLSRRRPGHRASVCGVGASAAPTTGFSLERSPSFTVAPPSASNPSGGRRGAHSPTLTWFPPRGGSHDAARFPRFSRSPNANRALEPQPGSTHRCRAGPSAARGQESPQPGANSTARRPRRAREQEPAHRFHNAPALDKTRELDPAVARLRPTCVGRRCRAQVQNARQASARPAGSSQTGSSTERLRASAPASDTSPPKCSQPPPRTAAWLALSARSKRLVHERVTCARDGSP